MSQFTVPPITHRSVTSLHPQQCWEVSFSWCSLLLWQGKPIDFSWLVRQNRWLCSLAAQSLRVSTHTAPSSCQQEWGQAVIGSRTESNAGGTQRREGTYFCPDCNNFSSLHLTMHAHCHSFIHSFIQTPGAAKSALILCDGVPCLR